MPYEMLPTHFTSAVTEHTLRVREAHRRAALGDVRPARRRRRRRTATDD
jgi:hypothetical protein